jgi:pimeloyl-ACP methyl ester carboxylesterase
MALRTSVGYNTERASLQLSDDQKKEAERLGQEAQREAAAGRYGEAMRRYQQGTAVMHGATWSPALELADSLQEKLDHALIEPGQKVTVSLVPLYPSERAAEEKISATIFLVPMAKDGPPEKSLAAKMLIEPAKLPFSEKITIPDAPVGDYGIEVRLTLPDGSSPEAVRGAFVKRLPVHIERLSADAQRLKDRIAKVKKPDAPALATAEYVAARYDQTERGEASPFRYDFRGEFASANAIIDAVDAGRDPFAGKQGDMRRAYRSKVDQSLQPYRVFVPSQYDGKKPAPLVVALHGMGGDENSMFDSYRETMKVEAQRVGFLVVCPKGRDSASMYRASAEQDVMDVLAEVQRDYRVDPARVYLMGHSMGGYGTWSVAMSHPDVFAALGPISGGGDTNALVKIKSIPAYIVHGDNDKTVNVLQSRRMVEAGKKIAMNIVYVEIPGGSHTDVAAPQFGPMLDFFAKQSKPAAGSAQ